MAAILPMTAPMTAPPSAPPNSRTVSLTAEPTPSQASGSVAVIMSVAAGIAIPAGLSGRLLASDPTLDQNGRRQLVAAPLARPNLPNINIVGTATRDRLSVKRSCGRDGG